MFYTYMETPAGTLLLTSDGEIITGMHWTVFRDAPKPDATWAERPELFSAVISQINEYFAGGRRDFSFTIAATGTPFQQAVWKELEAIPCGKTTTYQAIATAIGRPKAVRAVGTAIGHNPLCVVVPCHRVVATSGGLGGYAGGLDGKKLLLALEANLAGE